MVPSLGYVSYGSILRIGTCEIERVRKQSATPKPVNWVDRKATPKVVFAPELASSDPRGHACASKGAATNVRDRLQFGHCHPAKPLGRRGLRRSSSTLEVNNDQRNCRLPNHPGGEKTAPNVVFRPGPVRQEKRLTGAPMTASPALGPPVRTTFALGNNGALEQTARARRSARTSGKARNARIPSGARAPILSRHAQVHRPLL